MVVLLSATEAIMIFGIALCILTNHKKEIKTGTAIAILRDAGMDS